MTSTNSEPTYNLKAVVRETGLKPDTLRAWERRYGFPQRSVATVSRSQIARPGGIVFTLSKILTFSSGLWRVKKKG
jgi:hypothetical protein